MKPKDPEQEGSTGLSRRQLIKWGATMGSGLLIGSHLFKNAAFAQTQTGCVPPTDPSFLFTLDPFIDRLPIPAVKQPYKKDGGADYYHVVTKECTQQLHSQMPATRLWGYDGLYPGLTIEAKVKRTVYLTVENQLKSDSYFICPDRYIDGATVLESENYNGPLITTHLHGGSVEHVDDGWPDFRYGPGLSYTHRYPNRQLPATLWYHDHAMAATRVHVYSGLAAFYILRDGYENNLPLPKGLYQGPGYGFEVPIVFQDRSFKHDGSLWFAGGAGGWAPEFFGDYPVVNGKIQPYMEVTPGKYRFRFLNGCNSRFLNLSLSPDGGAAAPKNGVHFWQIGTDGGLLPSPVGITPVTVPLPGSMATPPTMDQVLLMAPAERCDVIVDFSQWAPGTTITVKNDAPGPFPGGFAPNVPPTDPPSAMTSMMQFRVVAGKSVTYSIPSKLRTMPANPAPSVTRFITLVDHGSGMFGTGVGFPQMGASGIPAPNPTCPAMPIKDANGVPLMQMFPPDCDGNGEMPPMNAPHYPTLLINNAMWMEPPTETPKCGATEVWYWVNTAPDTHPMHMHQVQFKVLGRQSFDLAEYLKVNQHLGPGNNVQDHLLARDVRPFLLPTGMTPEGKGDNTIPSTLVSPDPNEMGWKDTVQCPPAMVTVTLATFGPQLGPYPFHCHIIDHEDNDMMRFFLVTASTPEPPIYDDTTLI